MNEIKVLDHGYVKLLNLAGPTRRIDQAYDADDTDPANTARMSFNQKDSGRTREQDMRLAEYLMKNQHSTPLESVVVWLEMKLPIFVARQFVRHRTVSLNEVSARYTTLPAEWYIPDPDVVMARSESNKQGRSNEPYPYRKAFLSLLDFQCRVSYNYYKSFSEDGLAPELARLLLHVNHYTKWSWQQNLWNVMHFLSLREHEHAQYEARVYAEAILQLLEEQLPELMKLYKTYKRKQ